MHTPDWPSIMADLAQPFPASAHRYRAGTTRKEKTEARAYAYVDSREYEHRLDEVVPGAWSCEFTPWGNNRIMCQLTIHDLTRGSTGEASEGRGPVGTTAEAQAFKRACSKFGIGRYIYDLPSPWVAYDDRSKRLTGTVNTNLNVLDLPLNYERAMDMQVAVDKLEPDRDKQLELASGVVKRRIIDLRQLSAEEAKTFYKSVSKQAA